MMPTTNGLVHRLQERTANAPLLLQDGRRQQHKACCRLESAQNSIESRRQFVNPGFAYAAPVSLLSIVGAQHEYDYMRTKRGETHGLFHMACQRRCKLWHRRVRNFGRLRQVEGAAALLDSCRASGVARGPRAHRHRGSGYRRRMRCASCSASQTRERHSPVNTQLCCFVFSGFERGRSIDSTRSMSSEEFTKGRRLTSVTLFTEPEVYNSKELPHTSRNYSRNSNSKLSRLRRHQASGERGM